MHLKIRISTTYELLKTEQLYEILRLDLCEVWLLKISFSISPVAALAALAAGGVEHPA
jgi:hypothetical protein